jgi:hypothetical protein
MRIIYLVIASDDPVHIKDERAQRQTWGLSEKEGIIWLRGSGKQYFDHNSNTLFVKVADNYQNILEKTVLGVNWCLENKSFDFIVRANVSTFFDQELVKKTLINLDNNELYIGGHVDYAQVSSKKATATRFINGGAIFLNYQSAKELAKLSPRDWEGTPDDVAISRYLESKGARLERVARNNVAFTGILTRRCYYRLKSSRNSDMASIRMIDLHRILTCKNVFMRQMYILKFHFNELKFFRKNHVNLLHYTLSVYGLLSSRRASRDN